jgi:hypothetical protein
MAGFVVALVDFVGAAVLFFYWPNCFDRINLCVTTDYFFQIDNAKVWAVLFLQVSTFYCFAYSKWKINFTKPLLDKDFRSFF